jgi:hypothetical protein
MTFFNWHAATDIWVYFAVVLPLTVVVMLAWVGLTRQSRAELKRLQRESTANYV